MATVTQETEGMRLPGSAGSNVLNVGDVGTATGGTPTGESAAGQNLPGGSGGGYASGDTTTQTPTPEPTPTPSPIPDYVQTTIRLDVNNPAYGSINVSAGTLFGDVNREVELTAHPNPGYVFSYWDISVLTPITPQPMPSATPVIEYIPPIGGGAGTGVGFGETLVTGEFGGMSQPKQTLNQI